MACVSPVLMVGLTDPPGPSGIDAQILPDAAQVRALIAVAGGVLGAVSKRWFGAELVTDVCNETSHVGSMCFRASVGLACGPEP